MKLLIQCAMAAFVFVGACIAAMLFCITREWIIGMVATNCLLSPGLLLMSVIYRAIGGTMKDTMFAHIAALAPAVLIDVAFYAAIFFGLVKLARVFVLKGTAPNPSTTTDQQPERL